MFGGPGKPLTFPAGSEMQRLAQLLSHAEHRVTRELARMLEDEGSTLDQWRILLVLADDASHSMSEIAAFALFPAPTLTRLIDRMVAENLVYRKADPRDRRRVLIHISSRGRAMHQRLAERIERSQAAMLADADASDLARLAALLTSLLERLR